MRLIVIPFHALDGGELQLDNHAQLFPLIHSVEADGAEIRKERMGEAELPLKATKEDVYSAPAELFDKHGRLNIEIFQLAEEMKRHGAGALKVSLGHYIPDVFEIESLIELMSHFQQSEVLYVENDQTSYGGKITPMESFFESVSLLDLPIGMTFDIGNWRYAGEDLLDAARRLSKYVRYIHLKETVMEGNQLITAPPELHKESLCSRVLSVLPENCPIGLEFPIRTKAEAVKYVSHFKRSEKDAGYSDVRRSNGHVHS
ncbi:hypothetical protein [Bacillus sp. SJS]|uniref:hypothetical protein n=1 Tax=Bacillus sp. SJS TaxID=1423321 RepID=UPI0004DD74AF|nr:hypothetical protein [Bacillus sp. SJS]KZZ85144.1 hypothetical protein AS29_008850 [Bacillus sp. SJS]